MRTASVKGSAVFVSDTQEPIWIERLWLNYNDNARVTRRLFESVAALGPVAVFHGGDLVARGSSGIDWGKFWEAFQPVSKHEIALFATPGNHEFLFDVARGRKLFEKSFPSFVTCQWQTVEMGPLAVILLNSNFSKMNEGEVAQQDQWLAAELTRLDQSPLIQAVVLLTHHSPFTNGKVVSSSVEVQSHFVPPYLVSKKARLMLSGHSHVFEHLKWGGKDFMVIGGGGGLLHSLQGGVKRRYQSLYPGQSRRGFFHYLKVEVDERGLLVTLQKYDESRLIFLSDYQVNL